MNLHISFGIYIISTKFMDNISALLHKREKTTFSYSDYMIFFSLLFSSVTQSCRTLCYPMECSTLGFPIHHQLLELIQAHVHWVSDAIQPSHSLSSPSPTFDHSQHQDIFKWVSSSHQVAKVLEFQLQHQSFQWIFRTDFLFFVRVLCVNYRNKQQFKIILFLFLLCFILLINCLEPFPLNPTDLM